MATIYDDQDQKTDTRLSEIAQTQKLHEAEKSASAPDYSQNKIGGGTSNPKSKTAGAPSKEETDKGLQDLENHANAGFFKQKAKDEEIDDDNEKHRRRFMGGTTKKGLWLAGGGALGGLTMLFLVVITIFSLLGNLKNVHFATMLRTVGLARFHYVMQKKFSATIFDAAVLTDKSTGSAAKALKSASPPRQLRQLGTEGLLKFEFEKGSSFGGIKKTNQFKGVEIDGKQFSLDEMSKGLGYGDNFNKLSRSEKRAVRLEFSEQVKFGMNEALKGESRFFRAKALENIRKVAGIRMVKWPDKARMYLGKSPKDARKLNLDDLKENVDGDDTKPKSKLKAIQDEADAAQDDAERAALNGESPGQTRTRWANTLRTTTRVSAAVFVTTTACIVHDMANSFEEAKKETEMRAMRLGHDALTAGGQTVEGDVYAEAPNADGARWDNAEKSVLYKQATGESKMTKNDQQQLSEIPSVGGPATTFASVIQVVDEVIFKQSVGGSLVDKLLGSVGVEKSLADIECNVLLNQYVQYSLAGTELAISIGSAGATGGVISALKAAISGALVAAGTIGLGQLLGTLIDKAVASYAGLDYGATQSGEPLYNQSQVGVNMVAQTGDRRVNYGRPLTDNEAKDAQEVAMANVKKEISEKPFAYRYFAIENPFSLTGALVARAPSNFTDLGHSARSELSSIASVFSTPQQLLSSIGSVFMPNRYAHAEQGQNVTQAGDVGAWSWTDAEQKRLDTEEKFETDEIDAYFDEHEDDLREKFDKCYTYELQADKPEDCTVGYLSSDEALYYRAHEVNITYADMIAGGIQ